VNTEPLENQSSAKGITELIDEGDFDSILELEDEWEADEEEAVEEETLVQQAAVPIYRAPLEIDPKALR